MARIKGRSTAPEVLFRRALSAAGMRGKSWKEIRGVRPDLVFPGKVALFVDGCFWHGCPHHYVAPRSSTDFWRKKLADNVVRDHRQTVALLANGWTVIRVWEHDIRNNAIVAAARIVKAMRTGKVRVDGWRVTKVDALSDGSERRVLRRLLDLRKWRIEKGSRITAKTGIPHREVLGEGTDLQP